MKNREDILQDILSVKQSNLLITAGTGVGKTYLSLKKAQSLNCKKVLVVIPKLVLIDNWNKEIAKWNEFNIIFKDIEYVTYVSLPKYIGKEYDMIIYDEAHHITERCLKAIPFIKSNYNILLSATIKRTQLPEFIKVFHGLYNYSVTLQDAINNEILPEPKIILIPLTLKSYRTTELIINPKGTSVKYIDYQTYRMNKLQIKQRPKSIKVIVKCTELEWYVENERDINGLWTKVSRTANPILKNCYLKKCGDRLTWLSERKTPYIATILTVLKDKKCRSITFCNNIKQTEQLGQTCINSKNPDSDKILDFFNRGTINHIQAVEMLTEGVNLYNCQVALFQSRNSSQRVMVQKIGRALRHQNPILLFPYFKNTREEELVKNIIEDYDKSMISSIDITDLEHSI